MYEIRLNTQPVYISYKVTLTPYRIYRPIIKLQGHCVTNIINVKVQDSILYPLLFFLGDNLDFRFLIIVLELEFTLSIIRFITDRTG